MSSVSRADPNKTVVDTSRLERKMPVKRTADVSDIRLGMAIADVRVADRSKEEKLALIASRQVQARGSAYLVRACLPRMRM